MAQEVVHINYMPITKFAAVLMEENILNRVYAPFFMNCCVQ